MVLLLLLAGMVAPTGVGTLNRSSPADGPLNVTSTSVPPTVAAPAPAGHGPPSEITGGMGWSGIDYRSTCAGCLPADPSLAVGSGYVLELSNGSERIWLVNGTFVHNETVGTLFGLANDSFSNAQVTFDLLTDRWFVLGDDLTTGRLILGASLSSDPTAAWALSTITPPNGTVPYQPLLAVDSVDAVATADEYATNGSFVGGQVWAINKSALLEGAPSSPVSVLGPDPNVLGLYPAAPLSASATLYLISDGNGSQDLLQLYALAGSPPGTVTISDPTNFTTATSPPPAAVQPGGGDLLGIGDGRVESAAWRASTLWAVATGACVPTGDNRTRSCLHLWQLNTATDTLEQDFLWSSGAGTYDFDPALSLATRGDVALVFGESSATLAPSFLATGQAVTGPANTLTDPITLHNGSGEYAPGSACANDVCPFGSAFSIAATPSTDVHFWAAGVYAPTNTTRNYWKTWVNQVAAWATLPVTFTATGLPAGTAWSVTINGQLVSSTNRSITVEEPNGSYTYTVLSPITGTAGARYLAATSAGTFLVAASAVTVTADYLAQYQVATTAGAMGGGTVYPGANWYDAGSAVTLSALAYSGFQFEGWTGVGAGSYTGPANPAQVTVGSPISEVASFWVAATYPVTFVESGLPADTNWTVTANGLANSSSGPTVVFNEPNGSYTYTVSTPVPGSSQVDYFATNASGSFDLQGAPLRVPAVYEAEYALTASVAVPGTGVVSPSTGWFVAGTSVNLSALANAGELFVGWTGAGAGSYTGAANPAPVVMNAPITETAQFAPATTYVVAYSQTGLPNGGVWSVTTNGVRATSTGSSVDLNLPNGTYSFDVLTTYTAANGSGYSASPAFGSFVLQGGGIHQTIAFSPVPPRAGAPATSTTGGSGTGIPDWVFAAVLVTLLIVVAILAVASRRPPEAPPSPAAPPSPPPPAAWDEGT